MKTESHLQLLGLSVLLLLSSCVNYKQVPYFQDVPDDGSVYETGHQIDRTEFTSLTIRPGDVLQISIQTIDPTSNTLTGWQQDPPQYGASSENLRTDVHAWNGYTVDDDGDIEMPVVGKIRVAGLSLTEIRAEVARIATKYYKDPIVNVRLSNFRVTVLGEVAHPGTFVMPDEEATVLDALAMAGDMTIYGKRTNVLLARKINGKEHLARFNLNSKAIYKSPFFYLKQGDMIYVQPTKGKASANDLVMIRYYTMITSTLSLLTIILTRTDVLK